MMRVFIVLKQNNMKICLVSFFMAFFCALAPMAAQGAIQEEASFERTSLDSLVARIERYWSLLSARQTLQAAAYVAANHEWTRMNTKGSAVR